MFDWLKTATYRDEVLTRKPGESKLDEGPATNNSRDRAYSTGRMAIAFGLCISTAILPTTFSTSDQNYSVNLSGVVARVTRDADHGTESVEVVNPDEAWLFRNAEALASVKRGLKQAAAHDFVPAPDLTFALSLDDENHG